MNSDEEKRKYNNGGEIDIAQLNDAELSSAIKSWAQGVAYFEKLLWACVHNNIMTAGSHPYTNPYLSIKANDSKKDKVKKLIHVMQEIDNAKIIIEPDGIGNLMIDNVDKYNDPIMSFYVDLSGEENLNRLFDTMAESLDSKNESDLRFADTLLSFHDFFAGKESQLVLNYAHTDNRYTFSMDCMNRNKENSDYYNNLFKNSEFTNIKNNENSRYGEMWEIEANSLNELNEKLENGLEIIKNGWSLDLPDEITDGMDSNERLHVMQRKFGDTQEGRGNFHNYLKGIQDEQKERANKFREQAEMKRKELDSEREHL